MRRRHHRRRHHSGRHGDDGPAGDPRRRGFRACRLSARRRGAADRRTRRAAGRGRPSDRARRPRSPRACRSPHAARLDLRGGAAAVLGRAQGGVSRRSAASRPTTTAWTAPSRARKLPQVLAGMRELSEKYGLRVANVFHAGDGNLHPLILYDANKPGELERAEDFGADILRLCVEVGGVLTGEHGVGVEKRDLMPTMFTEIDLDQQQRVKCAFDDKGLLNPGKVFPQLRPLRRTRPHACAAAASCRSRTFRGSERRRHDSMIHDDLQAARRQGRRGRRALGARRRRSRSRSSGSGSKRAHRPAGADADTTLDLSGAHRRHALRAGGTGAVGQGRHAARRDRGAGRSATARSSPSSRWTTARCSAARRARARIGGVLAANLVRPAPHQGGRRARSFPRLHRRVRARRDLQVRRPRGQERHRLRPLQAAGRLVGHARGDDRRHLQGAAAAGDRGDACWCSGLDDARAVAAMAAAMGSSCDVSGAAHLPRRRRASRLPTACRSARPRRRCGSKASRRRSRTAATRSTALLQAVRRDRRCSTQTQSRALWRAIRDVHAVRRRRPAGERPLWRISTAPTRGARARRG